MYVMYVEYVVKAHGEVRYKEAVQKLFDKYENMEWLESTQRKNLYLETWTFDLKSELDLFLAERAGDGDSEWRTIDEFIDGGHDKLNIWIFKRIQGEKSLHKGS